LKQLFGAFVCLLILLSQLGAGMAFYEAENEEQTLELSGYMGLGAGLLEYPDNNSMYSEEKGSAWSATFRLLLDADLAEAVHLAANVLQRSHSKLPLRPPFASLLPDDVERSSILTWEQHDSLNSRSELLVDALYLQYSVGRLEMAVGRQPVNLAATFYFTPNDFFAPFAPQTFFRSYKAGVDALRADYRLAELSQVTLLGVLAYDPDPSSSNSWSEDPNWSGSSLLARLSHEMAGFEWAVLVGTVDDQTISGGSLQGELFELVGLRMEGHYANPETTGGSSYYRLATGLEKLYANSFNWRVEYYHNSGSYAAFGTQGSNDAAFGCGYQFSPLLNGSFLALTNLDDDSLLFSGNLLYSLSDESELSLIISLPSGDKPTMVDPGSEFGRQPHTALLEYRLYL
jgi:hypothetical protein